MSEARKILLDMDSMDAYLSLFGMNDQHVALLEQECGVTIALRGSELYLMGKTRIRPWRRA